MGDFDLPIGQSSGPKYCYLIPSVFESNEVRFKKSLESLQKNSSSDTEYSMQPYRVIKQSSNETNTSLTGSFNIDQPGAGHELSVDSNDVYSASFTMPTTERQSATDSLDSVPPTSKLDECTLRIYVENISSKILFTHLSYIPDAGDGRPNVDSQSAETGQRTLKKQYSMDQSSKRFDSSSSTSSSNLKLPKISTIPATPTKTLTTAIGSSTSTDESKDERNIPTISTNTVQDEIAKLSSNISNQQADEETDSDPPPNETMC